MRECCVKTAAMHYSFDRKHVIYGCIQGSVPGLHVNAMHTASSIYLTFPTGLASSVRAPLLSESSTLEMLGRLLSLSSTFGLLMPASDLPDA